MDKKGIGTVLVLVVLGLFLGGLGFLPTYEHHVAVQESDPTTATVQSTDVEVKTDDDGDESYNPVVVYEYAIDGETFVGDNTYPGRFTRWHGSRSAAQDVVDRYGPGDEVTIHYNPADPGNAYLRNDGMPGSWFIGVGYAVVAVFGGAYLIRQGFSRRRQRTLMADTPTERVQSLSIGPSEIKGTAAADGEPLSAPFSDDDCIVASYEIEEYDDDDDDDGGNWKTIETETLSVPFYLEDRTGSVLVEPHDEATYDLDPDDWTETYVDSSDRGPAPIREFVGASASVGFPSHASGKDNDRKYRQNLVRDGESVYVFGTVHPRDEVEPGASNEERLVVRKADENGALSEPMFMISDDSEKSLTSRRRWALWRAPVGGLFLVVALVIVLGTFAPSLGLRLPILF